MSNVDVIHVHDADGRTLCGRDGESISLEEAHNPDDGRCFTCGACAVELAGGIEPAMGGSRP